MLKIEAANGDVGNVRHNNNNKTMAFICKSFIVSFDRQ